MSSQSFVNNRPGRRIAAASVRRRLCPSSSSARPSRRSRTIPHPRPASAQCQNYTGAGTISSCTTKSSAPRHGCRLEQRGRSGPPPRPQHSRPSSSGLRRTGQRALARDRGRGGSGSHRGRPDDCIGEPPAHRLRGAEQWPYVPVGPLSPMSQGHHGCGGRKETDPPGLSRPDVQPSQCIRWPARRARRQQSRGVWPGTGNGRAHKGELEVVASWTLAGLTARRVCIAVDL